MERETKTVKTPLGKEVEIKAYMTFGEKQEIQAIYLGGMKAEIGPDNKPVVKEIRGEILTEAQHKLIEMAVVSYDGAKENILQLILDIPASEGDFILAEIDKIYGSGF